LFCRIPTEACEARRHGNDTKQRNQVGDSIMQAKEWTRELGWSNPVEHTDTKKQRSMECTGERQSQEEQQAPQAGWLRPVGLTSI
jgi:hypothetical protein